MVSPEPPSKTYRFFKNFEKIVFFTDVFSEIKNDVFIYNITGRRSCYFLSPIFGNVTLIKRAIE